jgi:hypothetical protein
MLHSRQFITNKLNLHRKKTAGGKCFFRQKMTKMTACADKYFGRNVVAAGAFWQFVSSQKYFVLAAA